MFSERATAATIFSLAEATMAAAAAAVASIYIFSSLHFSKLVILKICSAIERGEVVGGEVI